uniref:Uncharacterized protein n=1 Tax=Strongyloides venezuelensis TaxID=75913 RepID=A0A0K0FP92_STRVS
MPHINEDSNKKKINRWTKSEISNFQGTSYSNEDNSDSTKQSMKKDYVDEKPVPLRYLIPLEWEKKNEDNFFTYVRLNELPACSFSRIK